ncbi:hypothetical protein FHS18_005576 [Paenibacillus phyllosphaerae]|uniref:Uncharacterized protein n=1 Tax=Paenibacillus phyllosphaerae TaxID=274593 RepID=A0A7W5B2Y3_9BACL|nr:hypothetical protein [Paenibacillus phyllosphaerae]MBB3113464.1 hypothetical protein [Paenibacillus phyllosphaerae]
MKNKMDLRCGLASVTSKGLLFNGLYYSSAEMIKLQWFSLAELHGSWELPILYDLYESRYVLMLDFDQLEIASIIDNKNEIDPIIIDSYQKAIRNLKVLLSMKRKH